MLTALDPILTALDPAGSMALLTTQGLKEGVVLTALGPTGGMALLTALDPMLTAPDPTEGMAMMAALNPMEGLAMLTLTAPDPTEGMAMLTVLDPTDCMAFLTDLNPLERMAFLTAPDPTAGPVEVGRLSVPGSNEERHLNLCPMASFYVPAAAIPKDEGCPSLAVVVPKDESNPSLPTPGSNDEWNLWNLNLNLLATLGRAASGPGPTDNHRKSLTMTGSAAYSPHLLRSSTNYPMGSNACVKQLSHPRLHPPYRRALHISLVRIQEPRVRS
jgi:hypothetical protein